MLVEPPDDEYAKPEEVARLLRVSVRTVVQWLREGKLPGVRVGRVWRIPRDRLMKFLDQ